MYLGLWGWSVQGQHIETDYTFALIRMAAKPPASGGDNAALFVSRDAGCGAPERGGCTLFDFDNGEDLAVHHDQVQFTEPATDVACHRSQALSPKPPFRLLLRSLAAG